MIGELLGVKHEDRKHFHYWSASLAAAIDIRSSVDVYLQASQATTEMSDYLRAIIAERRSEPKDDLISALCRVEEGGERRLS